MFVHTDRPVSLFRRRTFMLPAILLAVLAASGSVARAQSTDRLSNPRAAKMAAMCQRDLLKASVHFVGAKLDALGTCANRLFSCLQTGQSSKTCARSTDDCSSALARLVQGTMMP